MPLLQLLLLKKLVMYPHMFADGFKEMIIEMLLFCGYVMVCGRDKLKMRRREHGVVHAALTVSSATVGGVINKHKVQIRAIAQFETTELAVAKYCEAASRS